MSDNCRALSLYDSGDGSLTEWAERLNAEYDTQGVFDGGGEDDDAVYRREGVDPDAVETRTKRRLQRAERAREAWNVPAQCPHPTYCEEVDACIFHLSEEQREDFDVSADEVERRFLERISGDSNRYQTNQKLFVRSTIPRLDLTYRLVDSFDNKPIDFRFADIGELRLDDAVLNEKVLFDRGSVAECSCRNTHFAGGASFADTTVGGDTVTFQGCRFEGGADFARATFETGQLRFDEVQFHDEAEFAGADVAIDTQAAQRRKRHGETHVDITFRKAAFGGDATFRNLTVRCLGEDDIAEDVEIQVHFRRCRSTGNEFGFQRAELGQCEGDDASGLFGGVQGDTITVDEVSFRGADLEGSNVDFTATEVAADLDMESVNLSEGQKEFNKMRIEGALTFREANFSGGEVIFNDLEVTDTADFKRAKFGRNDVVMFHDTEFEQDLTFEKATITHGDLDFSELTVSSDASFENVRVSGEDATFSDAQFGGSACFRHAQFDVQEATFARLRVEGTGAFSNAEFDCKRLDLSDATFGGLASFDHARIHGDRTDISDATFDGGVTFAQADLSGDVSFAGAELFGGTADFSSMNARTASLAFDATETPPESASAGQLVVDLTDAVVSTGRFTQPASSRTFYDFTEATVGDVTLRFSGEREDDETLFEYFRFRETEFDGFDFSDSEYRRDLKANGWRLHTFGIDGRGDARRQGALERSRELVEKYVRLASSGPEPEFAPNVLESTYRKARIGADQEGDSEAASKFFQKELGYRRRGHGYYTWLRDETDATDGVTESSRFKRAWFWLTNSTLWLISGYGERPKRVVLASLTIAGLFTLIYEATWWLLDVAPPETARGYAGSFLLSAEMFTAIILDGTTVNNDVIRAISYVEGFIGSLFIALFVLTITRAIRR